MKFIKAKFWSLAHSIASEHVAATVGGHPMVYEYNDQQTIPGNGEYSNQEVRDLQNLFYMPFGDAEAMWRIYNYDESKEKYFIATFSKLKNYFFV